MLTIKYLYIFEYQQVGDPKINLGTILKASKRGNITPVLWSSSVDIFIECL